MKKQASHQGEGENLKGIQELLELNRAHSEEFVSPATATARRLWRAQHPTEIAAFKCMDGRINLPVITQLPLGIIAPWRNIGGRFDIGWPLFGSELREWRDYAVSRGRHA